MSKEILTEEKAKKNPSGGVLVGKREGQTIIHDKGTAGGYLVGKLHKEGGIKGVNKATGQPIEVQGGEVIITAPAVADQTKREFEGEMLTNREILSRINEKGGGVSFANGGDIPKEVYYNGSSYNFGGKTMPDYEIMKEINNCGCEHGFEDDEFVKNKIEIVEYDDEYKSTPFTKPIIRKKIGVKFSEKLINNLKFKIDKNNFFLNTYAEFKDVTRKMFKKFKSDYISDSGSEYMYSEDGVYRKSDHWGWGIASCDWTLSTGNYGMKQLYGNDFKKYIEEKKEKGQKIGFCKWDDFKIKSSALPLNYENILNGKPIPIHVFKFEYFPIIPTKYMSKELLEYMRDFRTFETQEFEKMDEEHQKFILENIKNIEYHEIPYEIKKYKKNAPDLPFSSIPRNKLKIGLEFKPKYQNVKKVITNIIDDEIEVSSFSIRKHEFSSGGSISDGVSLGYSMEINNPEIMENLKNDMYADGGEVFSSVVTEWDKVPSNYKNISKVKKVPFTNNPMDKGLDNILSPFLSKDELRPMMTGINFDKNGITATNAHILINLPYPNEKYNSIYDVNKVKKTKSNEILTIDGNYPDYKSIIPNSDNAGTSYTIEVYKLLQYTKTAINYSNKITNLIVFKFGDNQKIGFNGKLLIDILTSALKLGHEKIYAFIQSESRMMILSPKKNYEVGSDELLLIMPVMIMQNDYGALDVDLGKDFRVYFDFNDSEIHNADGSIAIFKMEYEDNLPISKEKLAVLGKLASKNKTIPILNYVKAQNGVLIATDLEYTIRVKANGIPDGVYLIENNAPTITMESLEDFPQQPIYKKGEITSTKSGDKDTSFEFITFSEVFEYYFDKLNLSVGKDNLRPIMSGLHINKTSDNKLFLVTTDAHSLCKINITEFCDFNKDNEEHKYTIPVAYLKDFLKIADGSLHFKMNISNTFIEANDVEYICRNIDGNYPNYDAVIPRDLTKKISFDNAKINSCLKSESTKNFIQKHKKINGISIYNVGNELHLMAIKLSGNRITEIIETIKLCDLDFNYENVSTYKNLDESLFLLMPVVKPDGFDNSYFFFNYFLFERMLDTITQSEIVCEFSEFNRAYIFSIDSIDYKKTLPEEKTKHQPKKKAESKKKEIDIKKQQIREAIETLLILAEMEADEQQRKEIYEALEVLNIIKESSFESGGILDKKIVFEPIKTPLN